MAGESIHILIVANSARMLVQAAAEAGFKPIAIDMFADRDTVDVADVVIKTPSLAASDLATALSKVNACYSIAGVVVGSGFESHPDCVAMLAHRFVLQGNQPPVLNRLLDKIEFFAILDRLSVPYPVISMRKPADGGEWLLKPMKGHGGIGIRRYRHDVVPDENVYWQKLQKGDPLSVLFLADGKQCQIIGFHKQSAIALNDRHEYLFSGIITTDDLNDPLKNKIAAWLADLVVHYSLKGLNSMDFILSGQDCYVLEINPRPSASMQLYDQDLFSLHLEACAGKLRPFTMIKNGSCGFRIVYAERELVIPAGFDWPDGFHDLPNDNTRVNAGQPICSMIIRARKQETVEKLLSERQEFITNALERFQTHAI